MCGGGSPVALALDAVLVVKKNTLKQESHEMQTELKL